MREDTKDRGMLLFVFVYFATSPAAAAAATAAAASVKLSGTNLTASKIEMKPVNTIQVSGNR